MCFFDIKATCLELQKDGSIEKKRLAKVIKKTIKTRGRDVTNQSQSQYVREFVTTGFVQLRWVIAKGLSEGEEEAHLLIAMEQGDLLQL
ncbi:hypothetical protein YC2023_048789 [Brassica napus]